MMKIKQINNIDIKPVKIENSDVPFKGYEMFENPYSSIFICAKRNSGKTTIIFNIIKKCANKNTTVHIFSSTVYKDQTYEKILGYLEDHEIPNDIHTSLIEDGQNILADVIKEMSEDNKSESESEKIEYDSDGNEKKSRPKRKYTPKYIVPKHLFIFDDLGSALRSPDIDMCLKVGRHWKSMIIISSQYINDLNISARLNLDYLLLFKNLPAQKLSEIYKDIDLSTPPEKFLEYYNAATSENYNFLYVDIRRERFRINFKYEIVNHELE